MLRYKMFLRMVTAALIKRKSRVTIALLAIVLGTGVISGLLNVYFDINAKMSKEMRSYGANLVVAPSRAETKGLGLADLEKIAAMELDRDNLVGYAPYLYRVVQVDQSKLVMVGTWFDQVSKVSPYWQVTGKLPVQRDNLTEVVIGQAVADRLKLNLGDQIDLQEEETGKQGVFTIKGIVKTGSTEDNQLFVSLKAAQELSGRLDTVDIAYYSIMAKGDQLDQLAVKARSALPGLEIKPIKQIAQSEGIILEKIKSLVYLVVIVILLSTLLCVSITMMAMVMERRKEIGLSKALGAQNRSIIGQFLGESFALGLVGGLVGVGFGYGFAQLIGQSVFHETITFRPMVLFIVCGLSVLVSALAAILPVKQAIGVEPALVLKGE